MINKMVDRVAMVIWASKKPIRQPTYSDMCECVDYAKAAIEAMREPTEKMLEPVTNADGFYVNSDPVKCWQAMIDAALKD